MDGLIGLAAPWRALLRMTGTDARAVLQSVVSNDVDRLASGRAVYAALLTPQGKYLFDFFLLQDGDTILIDVAADRAEALAKRLKMYCLRRDARIEPAGDLGVGLVWPGGQAAHPPTPASPPGQAATVVADPRDDALGWRVCARDPAAALAAMGAHAAERSALDALRVRRVVPETGVELIAEETFILEAGFARLSGVDFRKGCYVGQEVTARMHHKATLKKRLVPVAVEGDAPAGTPAVTGEGKPAGTLFSQADGRGIAHLRLDRAEGPLTAGDAALRYDPAADPDASSAARAASPVR